MLVAAIFFRCCYVGAVACVLGSFILLIFKKAKEMEKNYFTKEELRNFKYNISMEKYKEKADELIDLFYISENVIASQLDNDLYLKEKKLAINNSIVCVEQILGVMENPFATEYGYWLNVKKYLQNELQKIK